MKPFGAFMLGALRQGSTEARGSDAVLRAGGLVGLGALRGGGFRQGNSVSKHN